MLAQERAPKVVEDKHYRRTLEIVLRQVESKWEIRLNSGNWMPATDVEIVLWTRLQEAEKRSGGR